MTIYRSIQAVPAGSGKGRIFLTENTSAGGGTVRFFLYHSNVRGVESNLIFDFSGAPLIINNIIGYFSFEAAAMPTLNDVVSYSITGFEED